MPLSSTTFVFTCDAAALGWERPLLCTPKEWFFFLVCDYFKDYVVYLQRTSRDEGRDTSPAQPSLGLETRARNFV